MTPLFPAQRAAEEFEQALGGTATQAVADRYGDLLETVEVLRAQPEVLPRAEFADELRLRLMTAAETELVAAPNVVRLAPRRTSKTRRRLGTAAASLVIVGGTAGMAAAASGALPGEPLYPVKRGVEQAGAAVRMSDAAEGEALLRQAATRLDEVRALQAQGSADPELLATTLDSFRTAADEGSQKLFTAYQAEGNSQDITTVRDFTAAQMADVAALAASTSTPRPTRALLDAADTLADIDQQARVLCGTCGPEAALAPPEALSAGAGAAAADNLLARPATQAQVDIAALEAARNAALKAGASAAEATASTIPQLEATTGARWPERPAPPTSDRPWPAPSRRTAAWSPRSRAGQGAVKDLVTGVTGTVTDTTGKVVKPGTPLDDVVGGLTGTLDKTTGELLPDQD